MISNFFQNLGYHTKAGAPWNFAGLLDVYLVKVAVYSSLKQ
jgi:hypothetical protein